MSATRASRSRSATGSSPMKFQQSHENDAANIVVVHDPGVYNRLASLHPAGSLYENPIKLSESREDHANFVRALQRHGVTVYTVRQVLAMDVDTDPLAREDLVNFAFQRLQYKPAPSLAAELDTLTDEEKRLLSDEYKRWVVEHMDSDTLISVLLSIPTVLLERSDQQSVPLTVAKITVEPLGNMVFTRDQQVVTANGIVMANLNTPPRKPEVEVMRFVWEKLGFEIIGEIKDPGTLEGGDFFMARDMALIGCGLRTNMIAIQSMLDGDMFGTEKVVVVHDRYDRHQERMHLDCVFNFASDKVVVMLETLIGPESPTRREITEYTRNSDGDYTITQDGTEFSEYLKSLGYHIIPVKEEDQLGYAVNFVNLGNGNLIAVHPATARILYRHPQFEGYVDVIQYKGITDMYGAVHCSSQICRRLPPSLAQTPVSSPGPVEDADGTVSPPPGTMARIAPQIASNAPPSPLITVGGKKMRQPFPVENGSVASTRLPADSLKAGIAAATAAAAAVSLDSAQVPEPKQ